MARLELAMAKEAPGYVYMINGMGIRLLKLVDENKAVSELSVPSSTSRDLLDVTLVREGAGLKLQTSAGYLFMAENDMEYFDDGIKEIDLTTGEAKWFRVSDSMVNREVTLAERPKNSAVYVYNKYGEVIYTTHIVDETIHLPMPEGG